MQGKSPTASKRDLEEYLASKNVRNILKDLLQHICIERPPNPIEFILQYLSTTHALETTEAVATEEHQAAEEHNPVGEDLLDAESQSSEESDGEPNPEAMVPPPQYQRGRRNAIAVAPASAVKIEDLPKYPKDDTARHHIGQVLAKNLLFSHLDDHQKDILIDAMFERNAHTAEVVIRQGEQGDLFYIIGSGEVEYHITKGGVTQCVGRSGPGQSFGELALMYGSPRAATVVCATDCMFWVMDRNTFRSILLETTLSKRQRYQDFLAQVPILSQLTPYELSTVSDALQPSTFTDGQVIVQQGELGDRFYIVEEGCVIVTRVDPGQTPMEVNRLRPPQFFGEIALISANHCRRATVTASGNVRCLALDRDSFTRLLGPLEDILKRNTTQYNLYFSSQI
ncbi:putative cAMP-dependent protein kinase type I regulatory subunit [Paratrimastix pyriformis]|uniref:cAMP-dependent protein kinase type I regulatory subunit n=1 Tax=Paratrimastix pyriformis TaxID=342808 RepID=A0ABQ8UAK6_9EUKA|nr:putative cAMP-dependent protein kinase type I regulatory subunit [Paratrimastix pyriformis]